MGYQLVVDAHLHHICFVLDIFYPTLLKIKMFIPEKSFLVYKGHPRVSPCAAVSRMCLSYKKN